MNNFSPVIHPTYTLRASCVVNVAWLCKAECSVSRGRLLKPNAGKPVLESFHFRRQFNSGMAGKCAPIHQVIVRYDRNQRDAVRDERQYFCRQSPAAGFKRAETVGNGKVWPLIQCLPQGDACGRHAGMVETA